MLKMQIIGHIGQDATIKKTNDGKEFISFTVAHTERWKDETGTQHEKTEWVNVTSNALKLAQYIRKGDLIYVEGNPSFNLYNDQANKVRYSVNLRAETIKLLSPKKEEETAG